MINSDNIKYKLLKITSSNIASWKTSLLNKENPFWIGKRGWNSRPVTIPRLRNNKVKWPYLIIFYILIRILKFAFALSFGIFYIWVQEIMILSWCLWSVLVLIISNKNIWKLKLTNHINWDLKISQVEELQFCCSAGICKNK